MPRRSRTLARRARRSAASFESVGSDPRVLVRCAPPVTCRARARCCPFAAERPRSPLELVVGLLEARVLGIVLQSPVELLSRARLLSLIEVDARAPVARLGCARAQV